MLDAGQLGMRLVLSLFQSIMVHGGFAASAFIGRKKSSPSLLLVFSLALGDERF
jgi:hypothetical protein